MSCRVELIFLMFLCQWVLGSYTYYEDFTKGPFKKVVFGIAIKDPNLMNRTVETVCKCKSMCFAQPSCNIVSVVHTGNGLEVNCLMANRSLHLSRIEQSTGATFVKKTAKLDAYLPASDGLFYFVSEDALSYDGSVSVCHDSYSGRLAIFRTDGQIEIANKCINDLGYWWLRVGLKYESPKLVWNDGTPYTLPTSLVLTYPYLQYMNSYVLLPNTAVPFTYFDINILSHCLCQANYHNITVNW